MQGRITLVDRQFSHQTNVLEPKEQLGRGADQAKFDQPGEDPEELEPMLGGAECEDLISKAMLS